MRCSFHQQDVQMSCGRNRYSSSSDKSGNAWCIPRFPLRCSPRQRQTMNAHPYHDNVSSRKCSSKLSALAQNRLSDSCICFSDGLETSDRTLCHKYVFHKLPHLQGKSCRFFFFFNATNQYAASLRTPAACT